MRTKRIFATGLLAFLGASLLAQDPAPPKAPDPNLAEQLKQLKSALADRNQARDPEATNLIDKLLQGYEAMVAKDQASVRKALDELLTTKAVKREPEQKAVFVAAAYALGKMGQDGGKILVRAYESDKWKHRDWVEMRAVIVKNVGFTKDLAYVKFLTDEAVRDPDDPIMRAAGEALANYEDAEEKVRKEIASELIKKYGEVYGNANKNVDPNDAGVARERDRLNAISQAWNQTLSQLTGQSCTTAPEWQKFWNKNKDKSWAKG